ncbi:MAG: hypothetical protein JSV39_02205, partial [Candidatus Aenigmatarchaeota archaeon]
MEDVGIFLKISALFIICLLVLSFGETGVVSAVEDSDGDGYTSDVDCDDNDARVNPGQPHDYCSRDGTAGSYSGKDFDCDGFYENGADTEKPEPNGAFLSDLPDMIYEKGKIYRNPNSPDEFIEDYCLDSNRVSEVYCCTPGAGSLACGQTYDCPNGCIDGACVEVSDQDGDGIPDSEDNCPTFYNPDQNDYVTVWVAEDVEDNSDTPDADAWTWWECNNPWTNLVDENWDTYGERCGNGEAIVY